MGAEWLARVIIVLLAGCLLAPRAAAEGPGPWRAPLEAARWQAVPGEVRAGELPRLLTVLDGPASASPTGPAWSVQESVQGAVFKVSGRVPSPRTMVWSESLPAPDLSAHPYYVVRYRALGLARSYGPVGLVVLSGRDTSGKPATEPLLDVAHVLNDGLWHTVVGARKPALTAETLRAQVGTIDSEGLFELGLLEFHSEAPRPQVDLACETALQPVAAARFECVDLSSHLNDTCAAAFERVLQREGLVTDGGSLFGAEEVACAGVPFRARPEGNNLIRPEENAAVNDAPVEVLGVKTTRHYFEPLGRDDAIAVPLDGHASEVFFVLVAEPAKGGPRYNQPRGPQDTSDVGALAVEVQYADGESDFAYPYSLADGGFAVRRMVGAYAMPADPDRRLKSFVLHNRLFGRTFSLAAVTLNTARARLLPQLAADPPPVRVPRHRPPASRRPFVRQTGGRLELGNSFYEVVVDTGRGFSLTRLVNRWSPTEIALDGASGLEVLVGDRLLTGRAFRTQSVTVDGTGATLALRSTVAEAPLDLTVRLSVDDSPQLKLNLSLVNTGATTLSAAVRFPVLRGLTVGKPEDTWMFFPQYRNVISNEPGSYLVPNDRSFPMQFLDVYNPRAGVGLALLTHNLDGAPLDYSVGKDARGVMAFVQSPEEFCSLPPGETVRFVETCLVAHSGDWHAAVRAYQDWLATWYRPVHAQDKDWFRRLFLMRVHLTKKAYSWAIPIYDAERRTYRVDDFVKADEDYSKATPEIVHLGGWCDYDREHAGDFLGGDYAIKDYTGGAEALRAAVRAFQEGHRIPVSLYMIPDRCSKQSEVGRRLGEKLACRRADGSLTEDEYQWYVCPGARQWQDHYVEAVRRTQRETGVRAIYVDVFGFARGVRCYSREHGHEVPLQVNRATHELIRRIREALPAEVALWSEFPLDDRSAPYLDGNIHYYCLAWHEYFSTPHDRFERAPQCAPTAQNAYRFVFPGLRQFVFLCGSQDWSSDSKFPFFNGEPLYDCAWCLYSGAHLERMRKSLALQKRFADCFSSDGPAPEAPTERWEVHANRFPGEARTVWTLYNARYTTVRGPVLAVDHQPGATYHDGWNNRPLEPRIVGGRAILSLTLHPQELGCVVQQRRK